MAGRPSGAPSWHIRPAPQVQSVHIYLEDTLKIADILRVESDNKNCIHLIRDRLFWSVYEMSAYYFVNNFKSYKVHSKFVQNVKRDIVWLWFPDSALSKILDMAESQGCAVSNISPDHILVDGLQTMDGYSVWREGIIRLTRIVDGKPKSSVKNSEYFLFKRLYDFSIYTLKLVPKFDRVYKFSLGQRLIDISLELSEQSFLYVNHCSKLNTERVVFGLMRMRVYFRMANELHLVSQKQWLFINSTIEVCLKMLPRESACLRTGGEVVEESSTLLAPD